MSHVPVVVFEESRNSPLYETGQEISGDDSGLLSPGENDSSSVRPRCIPASTTFRIGGIDSVNRQISTFPLLPITARKPLTYEDEGSSRHRQSLSAPTFSIADMLGQRRQTLIDGHRGRQPATIESGRYPGFNSSGPAPLPGGLSTQIHLCVVTSAQARLFGRHRLKKTWVEWFYEPESQCLFLDCFWWFFLDRFNRGSAEEARDNQALLYDRIARNYVALLFKPINPRHKELILTMYADVLSQAVYSAFVQCFSISWQLFNDQFKVDLYLTLSLWLGGTRPVPCHWRAWDYSLLDPPNEFKMVAFTEDEKKGRPQDKCFDLDKLLVDLEAGCPGRGSAASLTSSGNLRAAHPSKGEEGRGRNRAAVSIQMPGLVEKSSKQEEGASPKPPRLVRGEGKSPGQIGAQSVKGGWRPSLSRHKSASKVYAAAGNMEFEKVLFDTFGHSPLVLHFLKKKGLVFDGSVALMLKRTEISSHTKQSGATYQQTAHSIDRNLKTFEETFDRLYQDQKRKYVQFENKRIEEKIKHRREVEVILSRKKDVSRLSQFLTLQLLSGDQHKPMKSRQQAITEYLREEVDYITNNS